MASKKKGKKGRGGSHGLGVRGSVAGEIELARNLIQESRFEEALSLLRVIDGRIPNHFQVLQLLCHAAHECNDPVTFLDAADRLAQQDPNDPDFAAQRAYAFSRMGYAFLGQRYYQHVIDRWPTHPKAAMARQSLADVEPAFAKIREQVVALGCSHADLPDLGPRHDLIQVYLLRHRYMDARLAAQQLLSKYPRFVPAMNNMAEAYLHEGNLAQAMTVTRQALATAPDNVHAQSNLVRLLFLERKPDEVRREAARLKTLTIQRPENRLKQAEALALIGDEAGIGEVYAAAEQEGFQLPDGKLAYLHHIAAVATFRQGDEKRARQLWASCFKALPTFGLAGECIDDLDNPVGDQNGPWYANLDSWLPNSQLEELIRRCGNGGTAGSDARTREGVRQFLTQHPALVLSLEVILDRGPLLERGLAVHAFGIARTPEHLAALHPFALGQRGPDWTRVAAAFVVAQEGLLPGNEARLWLRGAWQTKQLPSMQISREVSGERESPRVERLMTQGNELLEEGEFERAERIFRQGLDEAKGPSLSYNHACALLGLGMEREAREILTEIRRQHPDYLFGIMHEARMNLDAGAIKEAERLIASVNNRPLMHVTEFNAWVLAQVELAQVKRQPEDARYWAYLLDAAFPDSPALPDIAAMVKWKR